MESLIEFSYFGNDKSDGRLPDILQSYPLESFNPFFKRDIKEHDKMRKAIENDGSEMAFNMRLWSEKDDKTFLYDEMLVTGEDNGFKNGNSAILARIPEGYIFSVMSSPYGLTRTNLLEKAKEMNDTLLQSEEINICSVDVEQLYLEHEGFIYGLNPKLTLLFRDEARPDPLDSVWKLETAKDVEFDLDKMKFYTAITENGEPFAIPFKNNGGFVVGGVAGSGKSASFLPLLTSMLYQEAIDLTLIDGKTAPTELDYFSEYGLADVYKFKTVDGEKNYEEILEVVKRFDEEVAERANTFREDFGVTNYWNIPKEERPELKMLVIDECQVFFNEVGKSPDEKDLIRKITATVENIIRIARAYGGMVCLATQKPSANSIPPDMRDNCGLKLSLRAETTSAEMTAIGEREEGLEERYFATRIGSQQQGVAITKAEQGGRERIRFMYYPDEALLEDLKMIRDSKL